MKRIQKELWALLALCMAPAVKAQTNARIHLPAVFSDHMVLQQQSSVPVWGWGPASGTVKIVGSWLPEDTVSVVVDNCGHWSARIPTARYGGPYALQVFQAGVPVNRVEIKDVMLGEVWLCSGQSNMEWTPNNGIQNRQEEIAAADYPNLRFFSLNKQGSPSLQEDCPASWESCTPEVMRRRSAVAYFFGRKLHQELGVPVGLLVSAWGGTPAEVWTPRDTVMAYKAIADVRDTRNYPWWPVEPGVLYNSMIHPLMPYDIAGAIWYQGESNRDNPLSYKLLMEKLIGSWRTGFGKDFPFYLVQIAPFNYGSANNGPALVREAQEQVTRCVPRTGMVPTIDIGDVNNIHPARKTEVGCRLASLALGEHYGMPNGGYAYPALTETAIKKDKIVLSFSRAENGLVAPGGKIDGLTVAGEDGRFVQAQARIKGNTLVVSSPEVKHPVAVRYCFDDATPGTLFNKEGMPVPPFRTDGNR